MVERHYIPRVIPKGMETHATLPLSFCFNLGLDSQEILELVAEAVTFAYGAHPFS